MLLLVFLLLMIIWSSFLSFFRLLSVLVILCHLRCLRLPKKPVYPIFISVGVLPSDFVALYLLEVHDEICRQLTICNDDYKFTVYPHSTVQEFAIKNVVIVMIHSERFFLRPESLYVLLES